jgi:TP901 family phage tail tape measure protein
MPEAGRATVKFVGDYSSLMAGLTSSLAPGKMKSVGMKAGLALGGAFAVAGVAKGLTDAVRVTKEFDKQISSLGAVANATERQMDRLRKQAIKLGGDTVFSATEAAKAQTELAKGGLSAAQILSGALKSSLDLAAAGEMDLAAAAETTVNAMQLFELQGKSTGKIADMLATAANRTTADVEDFAMSLKMGGSVAKQAGYDLNDTVVILEALAEAGIKNSDAGTSMKAAMIQLLNPTAKQSKLAKELGVNWITQNGELKNGIQISRELQRATADMTKAERTKAFAILAGTDGFRTLSSLYDAGVGTLKRYAAANREQGTAAEVAAKKTDNLAGDTEELSGAWETFQITIGTKVTPILRDLTQAATDAVKVVTEIFNDKNLSGGEKFQKIVELAIEAGIKGFEELTKAAVKAAPRVAEAFAKGFASAPIWMQLAGAGLMLKMFGGTAGLAAMGAKTGGVFMSAFASVTQTYSLARSFGRGRGASGFAGIGSLALPLASSLFSSLARIIPAVAATFAISDVIATVISGSLKEAIQKLAFVGGGAALGGLIGSVFPVVGTLIGAAIGAGLGSALSNLFGGGGEVERTLREKIRESSKRLAKGLQAEVASIGNLRGAIQGQVRARSKQKRAADEVARAERALNRARRQHGPASERARAAEARYKIALDNSRKAEDRLRRANRLQGAERRATVRIIRDNVQEAKANIGRLRTERVELQKQRAANLRNNGSLEELKDIQKNLSRNSKELDGAQGKVNRSIQRAAQVIGPKFAKALERISEKSAAISRVMPQLRRVTESSMNKSRDATNRASLKFEAFGEVVIGTRRTYGRNVGRLLPDATKTGMDRINELLQENLDAIQNTGSPQSKRRGGLIEGLRQQFRGGGVPVAVSPGEMFKQPDGRVGVVPGRPTAADNVLTSMPVGTKVFTFDGQRRLAEGASEGEALRSQLPHFAGGGIVKPEVSGGTRRGAEVANAAIGRLHEKATAKLKRARNLAARSRSGGSWSGGSGQYPGVSGDTDFMPALGNALSAMSKATGQTISVQSGWRSYEEQAALYAAYLNGTGNLAAPPGSSNHESGRAADITPGSEVFGGLAGRFGMGFTVPGESWHIELLRRGGIVGLLQALYSGGQVRVVKNVGRFLMKRGFDHRATAGILGNAYREGLWDPSTMEYTGAHNGGLYGFTTSPVSLQDMKNFASRRGKRWDDEIVQTNFMLSHGDPPGMALKGMLNANETIAESAEDFMTKWERPDMSVAGLSERIKAGHDASKILRDAGISGSSADSGPTAAEKAKAARKARRENREKQVRELIQKAFGAKSPQGKKGNLWQILSLYAKYGDFGAGKGGMLGGGVAPGGKFSEAEEFLRRVGGIASLTNPNRGSGQLYGLVKWLQGNVEMTGSGDANDRLFNKLERVKEKGGTRAETKRTKKMARLAKYGTDFPWKGALNKNANHIEVLDDLSQIISRENTADWSEFGSEYSQGEIDKERGVVQKLFTAQDNRYRMLMKAIPWAENAKKFYSKKVEAAKSNPSERWLLPGYKKGLDAVRGVLGSSRSDLKELVGASGDRTGLGGTRGDTYFRLRELGGMKPGNAPGTEGIDISGLRQIVEAAKFGVYDNLPQFHAGGVYRAPAGQVEGPALLRNNEVILTPEQAGAMGGNPQFTLVVEDGAVDANRIKLIADGRIVEFDRQRDQLAKVGRR